MRVFSETLWFLIRDLFLVSTAQHTKQTVRRQCNPEICSDIIYARLCLAKIYYCQWPPMYLIVKAAHLPEVDRRPWRLNPEKLWAEIVCVRAFYR